MTIRIYGDVAIDNYEYEFADDFSEAYSKHLIDEAEFPYPALRQGLSSLPNRFLARHFGGAYLLGRGISMALTVWSDNRVPMTRPLKGLTPWNDYHSKIFDLRKELSTSPTDFEDFLNLFYRLKKDSDGAYRVSPTGYAGFTLPSSIDNAAVKDRTLLRYLHGPHTPPRGAQNTKSVPLKIDGANSEKFLWVFNDSGTELMRDEGNWLEIDKDKDAKSGSKPWVIIKSQEPEILPQLFKNAKQVSLKFYKKFFEQFQDQAVLILNAQDLRRKKLAITRSLSWGQAIKDVVAHIRRKRLANLPRYLIITFDYDAAVLLKISANASNPSVDKAILVFSVDRSEGEFRTEFDGSMPGAQSMFVSALTALFYTKLSNNDPDPLLCDRFVETALTYSLIAKQRALQCGFSPITKSNMFTKLDLPTSNKRHQITNLTFHETIFALPALKDSNMDSPEETRKPMARMPSEEQSDVFRNPLKRAAKCPDRKQLLKDQKAYGLACLVLDNKWLTDSSKELFHIIEEKLPMSPAPFISYIKCGKVFEINTTNGDTTNSNEIQLPICHLGKIKSFSKDEIESLRAIRRLANSYITEEHRGKTPLALAVFGPPGAGKGFSIKSIFETFKSQAKDAIKNSFIECNLSGLNDPGEITPFFQKARDLRLKGKIPVLFFDEFDCSVKGRDLYWLKYFLAPLQDGTFTSGHTTHPIGKSIFVFAGGINPCFQKFMESAAAKDEAKGNDFLSRLQGHIDVEGLWPLNDERSPKELEPENLFEDREFRKFAMKRAIILRDLLKQRAPNIFRDCDGTKVAQIDDSVAEAFLCEPDYRHGVRSMEAVIRMSTLDDKRRFTPDCLPTAKQLEMHVSNNFHKWAFEIMVRVQ